MSPADASMTSGVGSSVVASSVCVALAVAAGSSPPGSPLLAGGHPAARVAVAARVAARRMAVVRMALSIPEGLPGMVVDVPGVVVAESAHVPAAPLVPQEQLYLGVEGQPGEPTLGVVLVVADRQEH